MLFFKKKRRIFLLTNIKKSNNPLDIRLTKKVKGQRNSFFSFLELIYNSFVPKGIITIRIIIKDCRDLKIEMSALEKYLTRKGYVIKLRNLTKILPEIFHKLELINLFVMRLVCKLLFHFCKECL